MNALEKYVAKNKLAHALMQKLAYEGKVPPASMATPKPKPPKAPQAPAGPGIKMVGRTPGKIMRGSDGNPLGPVGRSLTVGGGEPIYAKVTPKKRTLPSIQPPPNNLKAKYVQN